MRKRFLLCFHDFCVWNYQTVLPIIESLKDLAGRPFSILVVPSVDGASASIVSGFKQALSRLKEEGFELALHGFKHKAEFSQGRSYMGLVSMNVTGGEAEFAGLSECESSRLLQAGLDAWHELFPEGTEKRECPAAFVPPTWYSNKYLSRQVRAAKMLYENRFSMTTAKGKLYFSPVASFAGIPSAMQKGAILFAQSILNVPMGLPRLAIHPMDFPDLEKEIQNLIRLALANKRELVHYSEL